MNTFAHFTCRAENQELVSSQLIRSLGIPYDQIYSSAENIATIAEAGAKEKGADYVLLPFCHTVEAKAFGANIQPADETAGPRGGEYILINFKDVPITVIAEHSDVIRILHSFTILKRDGYHIIYQLSGPLSIFNCMMPLSAFFKACRKQPEIVAEIFTKLQKALLDFSEVLIARGVDYIAYADPACSPDILGAKYTAFMAINFTIPFMKELIGLCRGHCGLSICPLTAAALSQVHHIERLAAFGDFTVGCLKTKGTLACANYKLC